MIITDYYHQSSIIINHPNQSLWLLICVNLCQSVVYKPLAAAAPSAHKQSQLCCVGNHEQPRRGESLFASTEQPVYQLSPLYPEGKGEILGGDVEPLLAGEDG